MQPEIKTAQQVGQAIKKPEPTPEKPKPFELTRADQVTPSFDCFDFVEDLLTDGGMSVVYGRSNVGKSFWTLDLAAHVATGMPWRFDEHEVEQGSVIYVALEGNQGVRNRIEAMRREDILKPGAPLYLIFSSVSLLRPGDAARMVETVSTASEDCGDHVRFIVIDTLSRAMAGGDENGPKDMTQAVEAVDEIRKRTGAHVCLIHHCGKDEAKGSRGHSSLKAASDTEIELYRAEGEHCITATVTKQRDMPFASPMPFSLRCIELGTNRRGKPVTSCVVKQEDEVMASKPSKGGRKPKCTADEMLAYLPATTVKEWLSRVREETGLSETQFYEHKRVLEAQKRIRREVATNRLIAA